jgi:hypothetical protein
MAWYDYDEMRKHQSDSYEILSQYGEEGILEHIFDNIGETTKFCVDIGAMDGILNSVTHHIRNVRKWDSLLLEASKKHQEHAKRRGQDVKLRKVTAENVNALFLEYKTPTEIELINLDIDYNDYWVWKSILEANTYKSKVYVIEFNPSISVAESKVVKQNDNIISHPDTYYGGSLKAFYDLGKQFDYELLYVVWDNQKPDPTRAGRNVFFIQSKFLPNNYEVNLKQQHPKSYMEEWNKEAPETKEFINL